MSTNIPVDMQVGSQHTSKSSGDFQIIQYEGYQKITVRFLNTGSIRTTETSNIRRGIVKDLYAPSIYGEGYLGQGKYRAEVKGVRSKAYTTWHSMMTRCYSEIYQNKQPTYRDCSVAPCWKNFQVFAEWFEQNYIEGYALDKDKLIKDNRVYSPETCCFIPQAVNTEVSQAGEYCITHSSGKVYKGKNLNAFARKYNLSQGNLHSTLNPNSGRKQTKGFTLTKFVK